MPFIRYTRDKRGYDCTYVMHAYRPAQGPHRTRILYVFRSPAGSRVGRQPLDGEVKEALEHTHPDLTFDWQALLREPVEPPRSRMPARSDPAERRTRPVQRQAVQKPAIQKPLVVETPPEPVPARGVGDDASVLGSTLGAEAASRLRSRYGDLLQRIARRSRTAEERDRLVERARRLNPDDWPDEAGVRAAATTIEAEWLAIVTELPARRRGRRGGRRRGHGQPEAGAAPQPGTAPEAEAASASSVIIEDEGSHGNPDHDRTGWPDRPDAPAGDGGGVGSEPAAAPPEPGDVPGDD